MGKEIITFNHEQFGSLRAMLNNDGEALFMGTDVARRLGYKNPQKALRDHVDEDDKLTERIVLSGQRRELIFINESGLYALILSSKLPSAKAFKRWVTSEVLPQIRLTGGYIPTRNARTGERLTDEEIVKRAHVIIGRTLALKNAANERCVTATEVATAWGINVLQLNGLLQAVGIIERHGGRWHLAESLAGQGLAEDRHFFCYSLKGKPRATSYLVWTPEGVQFLEKRVRWLADSLLTETLQLSFTFSGALIA